MTAVQIGISLIPWYLILLALSRIHEDEAGCATGRALGRRVGGEEVEENVKHEMDNFSFK